LRGRKLQVGRSCLATITLLTIHLVTATLLSGVTRLLLSNHEQRDRLTTEIRTRFAQVEDITFDSLSECRLLHACLKEALRLYPPVPIGVPRIIPRGGQTVLGRWIPQDTRVSVHQYATYHSPANFRDPDRFAPERWLGDPYYANDAREAHQPFGYGPKNCIGQNMAMHEMKLVLASVLLVFDLKLCDPDEDWFDQQTFSMWIKKPLMCRVSAVSV
jgi:cytochrome P450